MHAWNKGFIQGPAQARYEQMAYQIDRAVRFLEASGVIHLGNIEDYARTGVPAISLGAVTHSAAALDISFELAT